MHFVAKFHLENEFVSSAGEVGVWSVSRLPSFICFSVMVGCHGDYRASANRSLMASSTHFHFRIELSEKLQLCKGVESNSGNEENWGGRGETGSFRLIHFDLIGLS